MDVFQKKDAAFTGILIMRGLAVGSVAMQYAAQNHMVEPEYNNSVARITLREMVKTPFSSVPFLATALISFLWTSGNIFGTTYYNAFLLDGVGLSYTFISLSTLIGLPLTILTSPKWNRLIRSRGWLPTLSISMALYSVCFLLNVFVTPRTTWIYLISGAYGKLVSNGVLLCVANLAYLFMPKSMQNSCLSFFNLCSSLASMAAATEQNTFAASPPEKRSVFLAYPLRTAPTSVSPPAPFCC